MAWAKAQPLAIVQMFPERLWSRTALRDGHLVRLGASAPELPTAQLQIEGLPQRLERRKNADLVTVPIITLDALSMLHWARVASGSGASRTPGRTFDRAFIRRQAETGKFSPAVQSSSQRTAQERVALFRATASKPAQQLADLMAAAPVSLPVIDLLRDAFRSNFQEEVQQSHVAEVLLSGLLRRCDVAEDAVCHYEFFGDDSSNSEDRVRDILLGDASVSKSIAVLNVLSESICRKLKSPAQSFQALLAELQTSEGELQDAALPFARVGLSVLRRLGGEYAALAEKHIMTQIEINAALIPPLKTLEFEVVTIALEPEVAPPSSGIQLQPFRFETATIVEQAQIRSERRQGQQFVETLSNGISLEMVQIPGGRFQMGSPSDEPERFDSENRQHEVTVQPFFLSKYPITQAQWRAVAHLPQVNRSLKPEGSGFKGDRRPVERVSWWDAVEFCDRLSHHTRRSYRLPTEAEWEYACRAGTTTPFHVGETITTDLANYRGTDNEQFNWSGSYGQGPKGKYRQETTSVDHFGIANAFGLCDMHGNVWEWCADHWHENYENAPIDGSAWLTDDRDAFRVKCGGSWINYPWDCRSASRSGVYPDNQSDGIGFRVVCVVPRTL